MYSPELETLDQLVAADLRLEVIARLFPSQEDFVKGVVGLLECGDVVLVTLGGEDVPHWRWRQMFSEGTAFQELDHLQLRITAQGADRIG